jgi:hypothetical protein
MNHSSLPPAALRSAATVVAAVLITWALQEALAHAWPRELDGLGGVRRWSVAAFGLSACLTSLATNPSADRRLPGVVLLFSHGALIGVALGSVLPAILALVVDLGRCGPLSELELLLAALQRLVVPIPIVLTALPPPLVALALHERERRGLALASSLWVLLLAGLLVARARGWALFGDIVAQQGAVDALQGLRFGQTVWLIPSALALALALALSLRARLWLVLFACIGAGSALIDPLALVSAHIYDAVPAEAALESTVGPGLGSALPLLELQPSGHRYGGRQAGGDLEHTLIEHGFNDLGEAFLIDEFPAHPFHFAIQRAVHMAPHAGASCGELTTSLAMLRRYGVTLWLWPGRSSHTLRGGLGGAFQHPALTLMTYPPAIHDEPSRCAEVRLEPEGLFSADHRRLCALPEELDLVSSAVGACQGTLVVNPSAETPTALLFAVLDRLGGTHPDARFRDRIALRWPGLDPSDG